LRGGRLRQVGWIRMGVELHWWCYRKLRMNYYKTNLIGRGLLGWHHPPWTIRHTRKLSPIKNIFILSHTKIFILK
jgi:hypothetical protein